MTTVYLSWWRKTRVEQNVLPYISWIAAPHKASKVPGGIPTHKDKGAQIGHRRYMKVYLKRFADRDTRRPLAPYRSTQNDF
jgi:hypothetical protein